MPHRQDRLQQVGALLEPARHALYLYVRRRAPAEVGRDEAASAVGVSRKAAGFHLDRLSAVGLLEPIYRRLNGRSGPGAGRPAKLYRAASTEAAVSVPQRSYETAAQIFATALGLAPDSPSDDALRVAAHRAGRSLVARSRAASPAAADVLLEALTNGGFEPAWEGASLRLRNCPFEALRAGFKRPVCEMSLALHQGMLEGSGARELSATLKPAEGYCCVTFEPVVGSAAPRP